MRETYQHIDFRMDSCDETSVEEGLWSRGLPLQYYKIFPGKTSIYLNKGDYSGNGISEVDLVTAICESGEFPKGLKKCDPPQDIGRAVNYKRLLLLFEDEQASWVDYLESCGYRNEMPF